MQATLEGRFVVLINFSARVPDLRRSFLRFLVGLRVGHDAAPVGAEGGKVAGVSDD